MAVEGIPGSGKTTILEKLGRSRNVFARSTSSLTGIENSWKASYLPRWDPWDCLWSNPYQNFDAFLRWRGQMIRETCGLRPMKEGALVMEGSILPNYLAMAGLNCGWMTPFSAVNFLNTEKMSAYHTDNPDYVVVLRTSPEVALARLRKRQLPGDERVTSKFLVECHGALNRFIDDVPEAYYHRLFVIENDGPVEDVPKIVTRVRYRLGQMDSRRLGGLDVKLDVPWGPVCVPSEHFVRTLITDRLSRGIYRLAPECADCKKHSGDVPQPSSSPAGREGIWGDLD